MIPIELVDFPSARQSLRLEILGLFVSIGIIDQAKMTSIDVFIVDTLKCKCGLKLLILRRTDSFPSLEIVKENSEFQSEKILIKDFLNKYAELLIWSSASEKTLISLFNEM